MLIEPTAQDRLRRDETRIIRDRMAQAVVRFLDDRIEAQAALPGLKFARLCQAMPPIAFVYEPSLSVILLGSKRVALGETTYLYDESRFLLTSVNLPTIAQVLAASDAQPHVSLRMVIDLQLARELIADLDTEPTPEPGIGTGMATGPATIELLGALERLIELLDKPRDLLHLGPLIQREIIYRILTSSAGNQLRKTVLTGTCSQRVSKAIAWLHSHYTEPLRVEALAELASMGVSTLHHHFRVITAMSPLQYQKQLRLHEARRLLLVENLDAASAALRVGYESATQFNREYRRMFGAPPMRHVRELQSFAAVQAAGSEAMSITNR